MAQPVQTKEQVLHQLRLGLVPATENRDILVELGFEPLYRHIADGYHEHLWGRHVAAGQTGEGLYQLAIERAYLVPAA